MQIYEKQWTNSEHTESRIVEVYEDGTRQTVSSEQDEFQRWLAKGNVPAEVEYSPAPPEPEPSAPPAMPDGVRQHIAALRDYCVAHPDEALPVVRALAEEILGGGA